MPLLRLQKFLSEAGICSRRKGEAYIKSGLVSVNNSTVTELGTKIDPQKDLITFKGKRVTLKNDPIYIALNKPKGYVTSCRQAGDQIVIDLIDIPERVYPVGRLDKDSTGLLILTNDGDLHHRLSHPSFDHEKEYDVTVSREISDSSLARIGKGMPIMGTKTRPAKIKRISSRRFRIVLKEGRNRQIRRMVGKVGNQAKSLNRIRIANIKLGNLAPGSWRYLTKKERDQASGMM
jgi:23S rRNA pseudouridine2605 synthase/23S rRNA pseudouridine2604 synthase